MSAKDGLDLFFTGLVADPDAVIARTRRAGFANQALAETAAWTWEMASQVQHMAAEMGLPCLLMGGGGAQLRFDVRVQRGSRDVDFLIRATRGQVEELIQGLEARLAPLEDAPLFRFSLYRPRGRVKPLAMVRYDTHVPDLGGGDPTGHLIKLEFQLRADELPDGDELEAEVFPFAEPVRLHVPSIAYQIALKLMVVTSEAAGGAPPRREDVLPRQFYDLDQLFAVIGRGDWLSIKDGIRDLANREGLTGARVADVWAGIHARVDEWAAAVQGAGTHARHIATYNLEVPRSQQISRPQWRTRLRRLAFAVRYAQGTDDGAWFEATRIAVALDRPNRTRLATRWRRERDVAPARGPTCFCRPACELRLILRDLFSLLDCLPQSASNLECSIGPDLPGDFEHDQQASRRVNQSNV